MVNIMRNIRSLLTPRIYKTCRRQRFDQVPHLNAFYTFLSCILGFCQRWSYPERPCARVVDAARKALCWILIIDQFCSGIVHAFEGTIRFNVIENQHSGGLTFTVTKIGKHQDVAEEIALIPLNDKLTHYAHQGLSVQYSGRPGECHEAAYCLDRWLVKYTDQEGNNHLAFHILKDGAIQVSELAADQAKIEFSTPTSMNLKSTTMKASELSLVGSSIRNEARLSIDKELTVAALKGGMINTPGGQLIVNGEFHVLHGDLENQGRIASCFRNAPRTSQEPKKLVINLHHNRLINTPTHQAISVIHGADHLAIIQAREIINKAKIICEGFLSLDADRVENYKSISSLNRLHMKGGTLFNHHKIQAKTLQLSMQRWKNTKVIKADEQLDLIGKIGLNRGCLEGRDVLVHMSELDNDQDFLATQTLKVNVHTLMNRAMIKAAQINSMFFGRFVNKGIFEATKEIQLQHFFSLVNKKRGRIIAGGALDWRSPIQGNVLNQGMIHWESSSTLEVKKLWNKAHGQMKGGTGAWDVGKWINHHEILLRQGLCLSVHTGQNLHHLISHETLSLKVHHHFENQQQIGALKELSVGGKGRVINTCDGNITTSGMLSFHKLEKIKNFGLLKGGHALTLTRLQTLVNLGTLAWGGHSHFQKINQIRNHGVIYGESGQWDVVRFENHDTLHIQDHLSVIGFFLKNRGVFKSKTLMLRDFVHLKNGRAGSMMALETWNVVAPQAHFINRGIASTRNGMWDLRFLLNQDGMTLHGGSFSLRGEKLENQGSIESTGNLKLNFRERVLNQRRIKAPKLMIEEGQILVNDQEIHGEDIEVLKVKEFINKGEINGDRLTLKHLQIINNQGHLQAIQWLHIHSLNQIINKETAIINAQEVVKIFSPQGHVTNHGIVSAPIITGHIGTLMNTRSLEATSGPLTLIGQILNNQGEIKSRGELTFTFLKELLNHKTLYATGKLRIHESQKIINHQDIVAQNELELTTVTELDNRGAIQGLRLLMKDLHQIENQGHFQASETVKIQDVHVLNNHSQGVLSSVHFLDIASLSMTLTNHGMISGGSGAVQVHQLMNHQSGEITTGSITVKSQILENHGRMMCQQEFHLTPHQELFNDGLMAANQVLRIQGSGTFTNRQIQDLDTSGQVIAHQIQILDLSNLENDGCIGGQDDVHIQSVKTVTNKGLLVSDNTLRLSDLDQVVNTHVIQGRQIQITTQDLTNHKDVLAQDHLEIKSQRSFNNQAQVVSHGPMVLSLIVGALNQGVIHAGQTLSFNDTNLIQKGKILSHGMTLERSEIHNQGQIHTRTTLAGSLSQSLGQNQGVWIHEGEISPDTSTLMLNGEVTLQGTFSEGKMKEGITLKNKGQTILKASGAEGLAPVHLDNEGSLSCEGYEALTFASFLNIGQLYLQGDWQIQPGIKGDIQFISPRAASVTPTGALKTSFVNQGVLSVSGSLVFGLPIDLLNRAQIQGDLIYRLPLRSLGELSTLQGVQTVHVSLEQAINIQENLTLCGIESLVLTTAWPVTLAAHLMVHNLTLISTAPVVLGTDINHFGQLQAEGSLKIVAPTIQASYARLYAGDKLHLKGNLSLGGYEEKTPDASRYLGPWVGSAADDRFEKTGQNMYRAPNGTMIYGQTIDLEGSSLTLQYCSVLSDLLTQITSSEPLDVRAVTFMGNGDLHMEAPKITLRGEGTRKGIIEEEGTVRLRGYRRLRNGREVPNTRKIIKKTAYDYLLSPLTTIQQGGSVAFKVRQGIELVATSVSAAQVIVNGLTETHAQNGGYLHLQPIFLGKMPLSQRYWVHIKKKNGVYLNFGTLGRLMAGQAMPMEILWNKLSGTCRKPKRKLGFFVPFSPALTHTSVSEINLFGLALYDVGCCYIQRPDLDSTLRDAHERGTFYTHPKWSQASSSVVHTLTPQITVGQHLHFDLATLHGQTCLNTQGLTIRARDIHLSHGLRRQDPKRQDVLVNLEALPVTTILTTFQEIFGRSMPGILPPDYGEVPWVLSGGAPINAQFSSPEEEFCHLWRQGSWVPAMHSRLSVPLDMVLQAVMTAHGRVHHQGLSGRALAKKWVRDSQQLAKDKPVLSRAQDLQNLKQLLLVYLVHYDPRTKNYSQPQLNAHVPVEAQSPHQGPGVISLESGDIQASNQVNLQNVQLNVGQDLTLKGKNVLLESTSQTVREGNTIRTFVPAPMTLQAAPYAHVSIEAEETVELKGAQVQGNMSRQLGLTAGKEVKLTTLKMSDITRIKRGYIQKNHHEKTVIQGFDTYQEKAPAHYHQGVWIDNQQNHIEGKALKSETVVDYEHKRQTKIKKGGLRKQKKTLTTQTPIQASKPTYIGETTLDVDEAHLEGGCFYGKLIDRTKILELEPAVTECIHRLKQNSNWLGVTKGVKGSQGQEQVLKPEIHGIFISERRKDAQEAENILRFTSVLLDLYDSQIEKQLIKKEYVPKKWNKFKQTGNFKEVAMAASVLVTVVTMGYGGILMGGVFLQNMCLNAMANAAFSGLCSQAASSMIIHQGDLKQVGKDLMSSSTLRNLAVNVVTAGVTNGAFQYIDISSLPELAQHFTREMVRSAIKLNVDYVLEGGSYQKLLQHHALDGVISAMTSYLCSMVGTAYGQQNLNFLSHKVVHGVIGGLASAARGEDWVAGAMGAMVAESVADVYFRSAYQDIHSQQMALDQQVKSGTLSAREAHQRYEVLQNKIESLKESAMRLAKYAAIAAAVIAKRDPAVAIARATTALEANFNQHTGQKEKSGEEEIEDPDQDAQREVQSLFYQVSDRQLHHREIYRRFDEINLHSNTEIHLYDSEQECLNSWRNQVFGDRPPSPVTARRIEAKLSAVYERARSTQVGVNSYLVRYSLQASQGKEVYINERIKEFSQGKGLSPEEAEKRYRPAAEKHFEMHRQQEKSQEIGGPIALTAGIKQPVPVRVGGQRPSQSFNKLPVPKRTAPLTPNPSGKAGLTAPIRKPPSTPASLYGTKTEKVTANARGQTQRLVRDVKSGHLEAKGKQRLVPHGGRTETGSTTPLPRLHQKPMAKQEVRGKVNQRIQVKSPAPQKAANPVKNDKDSAKNVANYERYKQDLRHEQALREKIFNKEKVYSVKQLGMKGKNPGKTEVHSSSKQITVYTDINEPALQVYKKSVNQFKSEKFRGQATEEIFKPTRGGEGLQTKFKNGSSVSFRSESKTGTPKIEINDAYRNTYEKITIRE